MFIQALTNAGKELCTQGKELCTQTVNQAINYMSDAQVLKKTGQVFASALALIVVLDPGKHKSLSRLTNVILSINLIDGFRFMKLPQLFFLPVTAESIDEFAVVDVLTVALFLRKNPDISSVDKINEIPKENFEEIKGFAKRIVKEHLEAMSKCEEDACRTVEQFQERLLVRLKKDPGPIPNDLNVAEFTLKNFQHSATTLGLKDSLLRPSRLFDKVLTAIWVAVDIGSVFCYLKDWNLLDTAKLAMEMGQYSVLSFIKEMNLELTVIAGVCLGFVLDVIESIRKLHDETLLLSPQEKRHALLNIVTSSFEAVLFAGLYVTIKMGGASLMSPYVQGGIQAFAILSRLIGIGVSLMRPKHAFFQHPRPVTVTTAAAAAAA